MDTEQTYGDTPSSEVPPQAPVPETPVAPPAEAPSEPPAEESDEPEAAVEDNGAVSPGLGRPAQEATNPKVAGPPPVADQPGLGRAANPVEIPGPKPRLGSAGVGSAIEQARANADAHREALAEG